MLKRLQKMQPKMLLHQTHCKQRYLVITDKRSVVIRVTPAKAGVQKMVQLRT